MQRRDFMASGAALALLGLAGCSGGLRYSLIDKTIERATGKITEGSDAPQEVTDVWTFVRRPGSQWELSAIQPT